MTSACSRCGSFFEGAGTLCVPCAQREAMLTAQRARAKQLAVRTALAAGLSVVVIDATAVRTWMTSADFDAAGWIVVNTIPLGLWAVLTLVLRQSWPAVFFIGWFGLVGVAVDYSIISNPARAPRLVLITLVVHLLQLLALSQAFQLWRSNRAALKEGRTALR